MEIAILVGAGAPDLESPMIALPATWTNTAASGWDGDQWQLYRKGSDSIATLGSLWDSAEDAAEFMAALTPQPERHAVSSGNRVVLVAGAGDLAGKLAKLLLNSLAVSEEGE